MPFFKGIHFLTYGLPAKPAVVFLHGFMGSAEEWNNVTSSLKEKNFCVAIDLPGHGKSTDLEALSNIWNFKVLCQRLAELISHLGIPIFSLVGYSMGGRVAFNFAIKFPSHVTKLMVESSSLGIKNKTERIQRVNDDNRISERLLNIPIIKFLDIWYSLPVFSGLKEHTNYEKMIAQRVKNNPALLSKALIAFSTGRYSHLEKRLSSLKIPVRLVCGEKDTKYVEMYSAIKNNNPNFTLHIVKHCSHNTHFEQTDQFAEDLIQFLSL